MKQGLSNDTNHSKIHSSSVAQCSKQDGDIMPRHCSPRSNFDFSIWSECFNFKPHFRARQFIIYDIIFPHDIHPSIRFRSVLQSTTFRPGCCWCDEKKYKHCWFIPINDQNTVLNFAFWFDFFIGLRIKQQDPLEAILVIVGRTALIFFVWRLLEKKWKMTPFCAHAQWWSPWRLKNVENGHLAPSNLTSLLIAIDRNGFHRMKEEGQIYKTLPQIFLIFVLRLSYDLSNLLTILPRFFDFERP